MTAPATPHRSRSLRSRTRRRHESPVRDPRQAAPAGTPAGVGSAGPSSGRDVHVIGLTVAYQRGGRDVMPVQDFDLFAPAGRVTALLGPSGSGKTSVLSCLAAMLRPRHGAIWVGGIEVTALSRSAVDGFRRDHVGVVHQHYNLIPSLTAVENVVAPLRLSGVSRAEAARRAHSLLDELGVDAQRSRRPGAMSGGEQQRVAIARALASSPSLVLADEPTAHLDGLSVDAATSLLRSVADRGAAVIMATHDDRVLEAADQVVRLGGS